MIGRSGERGSWISVLVARLDDDDIKAKIMIHNRIASVYYVLTKTKLLIISERSKSALKKSKVDMTEWGR